jgi:mycofactocin system glycosyltransferase
MAPWVEVTGYVVPPEVRLGVTEAGAVLVRDGRAIALRLTPRGRQLLGAISSGGPASDPLAVPADPARAALLEQIARCGFLRRQWRAREEALPTVALIVPAFRRPKLVKRCLAAVRHLDYPAHLMETIVVDDASGDGGVTARVAAEAGARVVARRVNGGPAAARDSGISASRSDLLAFLDTDCVVDSKWLLRLVLELADPGVAAVACRVRTVPAFDSLSLFEAERSPLDMGLVFGDLDARGPNFFCPTANFVMRRAAYERCGGFSTNMRVGEDVDLCLRLIEGGWRVRYVPDPLVIHQTPRSPLEMARRRFVYGRSEPSLWERHPVTRQGIQTSLPRAGACLAMIAASRRGAVIPCLATAGSVFATQQVTRSAGRRVLGRLGDPGFVLGRVTSVLTNLSRYHAATLLAGEFALRRSFPVFATTCLVGAAVCDYATLRSRVPVPSYLALHALEDVAYSSGVVSGAVIRHAVLPGLGTGVRRRAAPQATLGAGQRTSARR